MEAQNFGAQMRDGVTVSGKKSKKGLVIGLSVGGTLLAVILAVALIFVFGQKGGSKDSDSFASIINEVVYDDEYTYYLSEGDRGSTARIMRVGNEPNAEPEVLYEVDQIRGDGWGQYPLGWLFLWDDKVCFLEITDASDDGNDEYGLYWISKDGEDHGTLASYEQLGELIDNERFRLRNIYYYEDALIFSNGQVFSWLDLKTGEFREQNDVINADKPIHFVAYDQGYYYYVAFDANIEVVGGTLYRKKEGAEPEKLCVMPQLAFTSESDHATLSTCVPKGDYLYFADETTIFRIHMENGDVETLASYEGAENRFAVSDAGLYYFKDMSLRFLNFETLEESIFNLPGDFNSIPEMIYADPSGSCWMKRWADSFQYYRFTPDEEGGSYTYFGKETNETDEPTQDDSVNNQEPVNTTELYANIVEIALDRCGRLSFGGTKNEFYAQGLFKIDLKDFNQDGIDELVLLYTQEGSGIYPEIEVYTVEDGEVVKLFSQKSREEFHEAAMSICLYQNAGNLYVPVYDSLDNNPVYVHLYGFDENGKFGEVYQYENNAFYMNQLPDGMEFTKCEETQFYTNTQFAYYDGFENVKEEMMESLQTDMEYMLNELGIGGVEENTSTNAFSAYDYEGDWVWKRENSDMTASLQLEATDASTLSGNLSFYRLFGDHLTITMSGNTGTITYESGAFGGTARFESDRLYLCLEDRAIYENNTISEMLGTTEFCFTASNSGESGFDVTSMLGEWTLEMAQPNTEYASRNLIRLNADGTMNLRAEDGSWLDYTYTIDETHFSFTYTKTGFSSSGTYVIDGDKLIFSEENDAN